MTAIITEECLLCKFRYSPNPMLQARILVPAQARCPACGGYGGIGIYECARCAGEGVITGDFPVSISFPPGLTGDNTVLVPLDRFGIRNIYLAVNFRPTSTDDS